MPAAAENAKQKGASHLFSDCWLVCKLKLQKAQGIVFIKTSAHLEQNNFENINNFKLKIEITLMPHYYPRYQHQHQYWHHSGYNQNQHQHEQHNQPGYDQVSDLMFNAVAMC